MQPTQKDKKDTEIINQNIFTEVTRIAQGTMKTGVTARDQLDLMPHYSLGKMFIT